MRKALPLAVAILIAVPLVVLIVMWTPRKYAVQGTITRGGKALQWQGDKISLLVIFVPTDRSRHRDLYRCEGDTQTGRYAVEVPAGEYRVSIQMMDPYPTHDLLQFRYALKDSPLIYEITGPRRLDIDLDPPADGARARRQRQKRDDDVQAPPAQDKGDQSH